MATFGSYKSPSAPEWSGEAITDANGVATFTFPAGLFTAAPVVNATRRGASSTTMYELTVTAITATQATVSLRKAASVTVLAISVTGASVVASGETIELNARRAG